MTTKKCLPMPFGLIGSCPKYQDGGEMKAVPFGLQAQRHASSYYAEPAEPAVVTETTEPSRKSTTTPFPISVIHGKTDDQNKPRDSLSMVRNGRKIDAGPTARKYRRCLPKSKSARQTIKADGVTPPATPKERPHKRRRRMRGGTELGAVEDVPAIFESDDDALRIHKHSAGRWPDSFRSSSAAISDSSVLGPDSSPSMNFSLASK